MVKEWRVEVRVKVPEFYDMLEWLRECGGLWSATSIFDIDGSLFCHVIFDDQDVAVYFKLKWAGQTE